MLVVAPFGELRQVLHDFRAVGVKDVRAVLVDQNAGRVVVVEGVAGDVVALVDDQDAFAHAVGQALGQHSPGEARADDEVIETLEPFLPGTLYGSQPVLRNGLHLQLGRAGADTLDLLPHRGPGLVP